MWHWRGYTQCLLSMWRKCWTVSSLGKRGSGSLSFLSFVSSLNKQQRRGEEKNWLMGGVERRPMDPLLPLFDPVMEGMLLSLSLLMFMLACATAGSISPSEKKRERESDESN